jgi:dTDP-4-amino-4,6-dideoxygalactose transaminase
VIKSGCFIFGPEVNAFEEEFAEYCGARHCVSLANGTDALELALRSLSIGAGKTVLTVANAGFYSTAAILATGARPIYVDVNPSTLLLDVADVARHLERKKIDAIIVTHLYGKLADIRRICELARAHAVPLIEDCAQAHGATLDNHKAGTFGDIGCFSFYPTKNLGALGDGGAIVTSRQDLANKVRQLRQYGWSGKYIVSASGGRNSRLDEMQAAVLRVKLPYLDGWNARRREIAALYSSGITNSKITVPSICGKEYVAHLYVIRVGERDSLKKHLDDSGVPSDVHYPVADYAQEAYHYLYGSLNLQVTEQACKEVLSLPCFPELTDAEVCRFIDRLNEW